MAEGFSSLADLKIVVDANTDKLNENLSLAKNTLHRFTSEGNTSLKGFDAAVARLGGVAETAREKFGAFTVGVQFLHAQLQDIDKVIAARAGDAGIGDEYGKVSTELSEFASSVLPGVTAGAAAAARSMLGLAEGVSATGAAVEDANPHLKIMAETVSEGLVDNIRELTHSFKRLMSRETWSADTAARELEWLERRAGETMERIDKIASEGPSFFTQVFGGDEAAAAVRELQSVTDQYERAIKQRADAIEKERLAKIAAREALGDATYEDTVEGLQKEITALERKAAVLGMTKGEAAAYAAVMKVVDALVESGAELTEHAAENLAELTDRFRELADAADGFAKAEQSTKFIEGLSREIRNLDQQSAGLTRTGAALAAYTAEQRIRNQVIDQGLVLDDQQRAKVEAAIATIRAKTIAHQEEKKAIDDARSAEKAFDAALLRLQKETNMLGVKAQALMNQTEAQEALSKSTREIHELQARGFKLSEAQIRALEAESEHYVEARRQLVEFERQMANVREAGQVVARGLEGAFAKWTEGSKISVKDMVRSMLADLAQLTFRKGVIEGIFGSGGGAGGNGGFLGSLASSLFSGGGGAAVGSWSTSVIPAFADGGRPPLDRPSLIGERGPELFWPDTAGTVIPNGAFGPSGSAGSHVTVHMPININAQGAYPESIADIKRELASAQASLPGRVVQVVREAQDRGIA